MTEPHYIDTTISPADMQLLSLIHSDYCREFRLDIGSSRAASKKTEIVELFSLGVRDRKLLRRAVRDLYNF